MHVQVLEYQVQLSSHFGCHLQKMVKNQTTFSTIPLTDNEATRENCIPSSDDVRPGMVYVLPTPEVPAVDL